MDEPDEPPSSRFLIQKAVFPGDDDYTFGCMKTRLLRLRIPHSCDGFYFAYPEMKDKMEVVQARPLWSFAGSRSVYLIR